MGRQATLSIMGLYNYDKTLFDLLTLPEGIDKDTVVNNIVTQCAHLEILYPNPEVMKGLIGIWSTTSQYTWEKWLETIELEYNPLDNYDRTETRSFSTTGSGTSTDSGSDSTNSTDSGSDSTAIDQTSKNEVAGFNTSNPANMATRDKNTLDNDSTTTYGKRNTTAITYGKANNNTFSRTDSETIRARGNIGVTSSMQLIDAQRQTALFNLYDAIKEDFKKRFCILVY